MHAALIRILPGLETWVAQPGKPHRARAIARYRRSMESSGVAPEEVYVLSDHDEASSTQTVESPKVLPLLLAGLAAVAAVGASVVWMGDAGEESAIDPVPTVPTMVAPTSTTAAAVAVAGAVAPEVEWRVLPISDQVTSAVVSDGLIYVVAGDQIVRTDVDLNIVETIEAPGNVVTFDASGETMIVGVGRPWDEPCDDSGGVFVSHDAGAGWTEIDLPGLARSDRLIAPQLPTVATLGHISVAAIRDGSALWAASCLAELAGIGPNSFAESWDDEEVRFDTAEGTVFVPWDDIGVSEAEIAWLDSNRSGGYGKGAPLFRIEGEAATDAGIDAFSIVRNGARLVVSETFPGDGVVYSSTDAVVWDSVPVSPSGRSRLSAARQHDGEFQISIDGGETWSTVPLLPDRYSSGGFVVTQDATLAFGRSGDGERGTLHSLDSAAGEWVSVDTSGATGDALWWSPVGTIGDRVIALRRGHQPALIIGRVGATGEALAAVEPGDIEELTFKGQMVPLPGIDERDVVEPRAEIAIADSVVVLVNGRLWSTDDFTGFRGLDVGEGRSVYAFDAIGQTIVAAAGAPPVAEEDLAPCVPQTVADTLMVSDDAGTTWSSHPLPQPIVPEGRIHTNRTTSMATDGNTVVLAITDWPSLDVECIASQLGYPNGMNGRFDRFTAIADDGEVVNIRFDDLDLTPDERHAVDDSSRSSSWAFGDSAWTQIEIGATGVAYDGEFVAFSMVPNLIVRSPDGFSWSTQPLVVGDLLTNNASRTVVVNDASGTRRLTTDTGRTWSILEVPEDWVFLDAVTVGETQYHTALADTLVLLKHDDEGWGGTDVRAIESTAPNGFIRSIDEFDGDLVLLTDTVDGPALLWGNLG